VYLYSQNKCCCRQKKICVSYTATSSLPSTGHVVCLPYFHVAKGRPGQRSPSFDRPEPSHRLTCYGTTETPGRIGFRRLSSAIPSARNQSPHIRPMYHRRLPTPKTPPLLLIHICGSWRKIALVTRSLWQSINIPLTRKTKEGSSTCGLGGLQACPSHFPLVTPWHNR
jgi:hypothetical protein